MVARCAGFCRRNCAPAIPSPTPSASAAQSHQLPADLLEALIDARSVLLDATSPLTEDGSVISCGRRKARFLRWVPVSSACPPALKFMQAALPRARRTVWRACCWNCRECSLAGRIPLAKVQLDSAGLTAEDLLAGAAGGAKIEALLGECSAQIRRNLDVARQFTATLPRAARLVFLPLALVEPYLRALERSGGALLREETRVAPFTRVCRIAAAHLFGRL